MYRLPLILFVAAAFTLPAVAQTDRVYPAGGGSAVIGKIKTISKQGVQITSSGKDRSFAVGDFDRVVFTGEPPELDRVRIALAEGNLDQASGELAKIDGSKIKDPNVTADVAFYTASIAAAAALSGNGDLAAAAGSSLNFVRANSDSYHFYETAEQLGDLAAALGNADQATRYYQSLQQAPSNELRFKSVYLTGKLALQQGDLANAKSQLQKVAGAGASTPGELRLKMLARAALAVVTAKAGDADKALADVGTLVAELTPTDTQMAAEIYNAQGASFEAAGDSIGAILAYLHTHLMFNAEASTHVEALKRLAELWGKTGQPDRAAAARGELQQRYPGLAG